MPTARIRYYLDAIGHGTAYIALEDDIVTRAPGCLQHWEGRQIHGLLAGINGTLEIWDGGRFVPAEHPIEDREEESHE